MHPIFIQAAYYGVVMILTIVIISLFLKGFFWKYLKVRTSFGKYVMVKLRGKMLDHYKVGWVEGKILKFKIKINKNTTTANIPLPDRLNFFYRCLGVAWIDIDEEKMAVCTVDYSAVSTNDVEVIDNIITRVETRPSITDNKQKIILIILIVVCIGILALAFMAYKNYTMTQTLSSYVYTGLNRCAAAGGTGTVIGSAAVI